MDTQDAINWMVSEGNSNDDALSKLSSSLISRFAEMDSSLAEDDQAKDMADDTPEIGGGGSASMADDGARHDETASSGEGIAGVDSSVRDVCEVSAETCHVSQRVRERQTYLAADLQRNVLTAIRDSLFNDPYIHDTAEAYGFPEDKRIAMVERNGLRCLTFYVRAAFFDDWLKRHSDCIGAKFTSRESPRPYSINIKENSTQAKKDKAGQIFYRYSCHRKSTKHQDKKQIRKTDKTRMRLPSIKCQCRSHINAIFRPRSTSDGMPGDTYKVDYFFEHNHKLGCAENIGTIRKSEVIKLKIKAMLMRGMPINAIMEQLTMDHTRFTRFLEGKETMVLPKAAIAFPNTDYRPNNQLEFRADSPPMGPMEDTSRHDEPAPTGLTDAQALTSAVDSIKNYISKMDPDKALPNKDEILSSLKKTLDLLHTHMPVKEGYSFSNKRRRQRPK